MLAVSSLPAESLFSFYFLRMRGVGKKLSRLTPTRTTTNWPLIILGLPSLFLVRGLTIVPLYLHLDLSKHVMRNVLLPCLSSMGS